MPHSNALNVIQHVLVLLMCQVPLKTPVWFWVSPATVTSLITPGIHISSEDHSWTVQYLGPRGDGGQDVTGEPAGDG